MNKKIVHISSVHGAWDTRILLRECVSMAAAGWDVAYVVPHEKDETYEGVRILAVKPNTGGRLRRMIQTSWRVYRRAKKEKAAIYHFHDPELIWIGFLLRWGGNKVVFDVHENISAQIKVKKWLPLRGMFSKLFRVADFFAAKSFALVLAENSYQPLYEKWSRRFITVLNMPDLGFFEKYRVADRSALGDELFYVGGISFDRGIDTVLAAIAILRKRGRIVKFHAIGPIFDSTLNEIKALPVYEEVKEQVIFYGRKRLDEAVEISKQCRIGLSVLKPIENYKRSYSTKIFEYMAMQLPVITSGFPLYRDVVDVHGCGICIDPENPESVADAIEKILSDTAAANKMGEQGRAAAQENFSWKQQADKLSNLYQSLTSPKK